MKPIPLLTLLLSLTIISAAQAQEAPLVVPDPYADTCDYSDFLGKHPEEINWIERFGRLPDAETRTGNTVTVSFPRGQVMYDLDDKGNVSKVLCKFKSAPELVQ